MSIPCCCSPRPCWCRKSRSSRWPTGCRRSLCWLLAAVALLLSALVDLRFEGWIVGGWALLGSVIISLIALLFVGRPILFMLGLTALMMSYGGWSKLYQSASGHAHPLLFRNLHGQRQGRSAVAPAHPRHDAPRRPESRSGRGAGADLLLCPPLRRRPCARLGAGPLRPPCRGSASSASARGTLSCYAHAGRGLADLRDRPGDGPHRANPLHLPPRLRAAAKIVLGDARLSLSRQPPGSLDILAVDAFSSDAVPMHLLTREALAVYARALSAARPAPRAHLEPLSRPRAGPRRRRRRTAGPARSSATSPGSTRMCTISALRSGWRWPATRSRSSG